MAALIAGDCAGGDHRGRLAAGIRVAKRGVEGYWLELQVDKSDDAVIELAKKYAELKHDAKGEWRGGKLPFEPPCPRRPKPKPPEKRSRVVVIRRGWGSRCPDWAARSRGRMGCAARAHTRRPAGPRSRAVGWVALRAHTYNPRQRGP